MFLYGTVLRCYCVTSVTDAITLLFYCASNVTIQYNVTLLLCYQGYCILQCYPVTVLLVLLYDVLPCYSFTNVTLCFNVTKLLCYQCYTMLQRYSVTVLLLLIYSIAFFCYCATSVSLYSSVTLIMCYQCYCVLLC